MEVEALKSEVEDANKESSDAPKGTDVRLREIKDAAVVRITSVVILGNFIYIITQQGLHPPFSLIKNRNNIE